MLYQGSFCYFQSSDKRGKSFLRRSIECGCISVVVIPLDSRLGGLTSILTQPLPNPHSGAIFQIKINLFLLEGLQCQGDSLVH